MENNDQPLQTLERAASEKPVMGRDLVVSLKRITLGGTAYDLKFNNNAARIAEDVYAEQFQKDIGYFRIMEHAVKLRHSALMALLYGAMIAGGASMPWAEFDAQFTLTSVEGMTEVMNQVLPGSLESLPKAEKPGKN